jgi:chromosome segregation ATPase
MSIQEQLDNMAAAKAKVERLRQKAQSELDDVAVQLANEKQSVAALQSKQRGFDKQISELKTQFEAANSELERTQAELRDAQSKILVLKNDLADMEQRAVTAEGAKKRLETELEELIQVCSADHSC